MEIKLCLNLKQEIILRDCVLYQSKASKTINWKNVMEMMPKRYQNRTPKKLRNKWRKLLFRKDFVSESDHKRLYRGKKDKEDIIPSKTMKNKKDLELRSSQLSKELESKTIEQQSKNFDFNDEMTKKWLKSLKSRIKRLETSKITNLEDLFKRQKTTKNINNINHTNNTTKTNITTKTNNTKNTKNTKIHQIPQIPQISQNFNKNLLGFPKNWKLVNFSNSQNNCSISLDAPSGPKKTNYQMTNYCKLFSPFRFGSVGSKRVPRLEFNFYRGYDRMSIIQLESLFFTYMRNIRIKRFKISESEKSIEKGKLENKILTKRYSQLKKQLERETSIYSQKERSHDKILWQLQSVQMEFRFLCEKKKNAELRRKKGLLK